MSRLVVLLVAVLVAACLREGAPPVKGEGPAAAAALGAPAEGRTVHIVRMLARGHRYTFEPAEVSVRAGDVVRFVHTDHQPESVAFDSASAPPEGAALLSSRQLLRGPLLTEPGTFFDVPFTDAPPGEYPFFSVPHRGFGMVGRVVVEP